MIPPGDGFDGRSDRGLFIVAWIVALALLLVVMGMIGSGAWR